MHYYDIKYSYKYFVSDNRNNWVYYTIPVWDLAKIYQRIIGQKPTSFFDCGCATGELLKQAEQMGMRVRGIDVKTYAPQNPQQEKHIQIISILNYNKKIEEDIVFCNGTLTYLNESDLDIALQKFRSAKMVIAIHNTTEDNESAGYHLSSTTEPRLIQNRSWWINRFQKAGFNSFFDSQSGCFINTPHIRE